MNKLLLSTVFCGLFAGLIGGQRAEGQSAILSEIYGQGVHSYYAGNSSGAYDLFSMAIDNGIKDPRAYYFRGIAAHDSGRSYEAESDWKQGAELEASGRVNASIGQALSRFQGPGRLKLEEIRRQARLQYLANAASRSRQRYGEIDEAQGNVLRAAPATPPAPAAGAKTPPAPPAPPVADENPFAADLGDPKVESDDALSDAMNDPFADDPAAAPAGDAADAPATDPFGGSNTGDPFGSDPAPASDPFGGGDAGSDPFGGDPFGN